MPKEMDDHLDFSAMAREQSGGVDEDDRLENELDDDVDTDIEDGDDLDDDGDEDGAGDEDSGSVAAGLRGMLQSKGFQLGDDVDDDALLDEMLGGLRQLQDTQQQLQHFQGLQPQVQEYLQHQQAFADWRKSQQETKSAEPEKPPGFEWNPPEVDKVAEQIVQMGLKEGVIETSGGMYVTTDPRFQAAVQSLNAHAQYYDQNLAHPLRQNPQDFIWKLVEAKVKEVLDASGQQQVEKVDSRFTEADERQQVHSRMAYLDPWMRQYDQAGKPIFDQQGRPVLNELGQEFLRDYQNSVSVLHGRGFIKDPQRPTPSEVLAVYDMISPRYVGIIQSAQNSTPQQDGKQKRKTARDAARSRGADKSRPVSKAKRKTSGELNGKPRKTRDPSLMSMIADRNRNEGDDID